MTWDYRIWNRHGEMKRADHPHNRQLSIWILAYWFYNRGVHWMCIIIRMSKVTKLLDDWKKMQFIKIKWIATKPLVDYPLPSSPPTPLATYLAIHQQWQYAFICNIYPHACHRNVPILLICFTNEFDTVPVTRASTRLRPLGTQTTAVFTKIVRECSVQSANVCSDICVQMKTVVITLIVLKTCLLVTINIFISLFIIRCHKSFNFYFIFGWCGICGYCMAGR